MQRCASASPPWRRSSPAQAHTLPSEESSSWHSLYASGCLLVVGCRKGAHAGGGAQTFCIREEVEQEFLHRRLTNSRGVQVQAQRIGEWALGRRFRCAFDALHTLALQGDPNRPHALPVGAIGAPVDYSATFPVPTA